jgi:hypothetical protein
MTTGKKRTILSKKDGVANGNPDLRLVNIWQRTDQPLD